MPADNEQTFMLAMGKLRYRNGDAALIAPGDIVTAVVVCQVVDTVAGDGTLGMMPMEFESLVKFDREEGQDG